MSRVENLKVNYANFHLDIPKWEIADQGVTALVGVSGSGKTTIIRVLLGLETAANVHWWWGSEDLAQIPMAQRRLGVVFQNYELFPHLTAVENIFFAASARKIPIERAKKTYDDLCHNLQLEAFAKTKAGLLSGGEKQRVALARALMGEPRFLFLDEPFAALDIGLRAEARKLVKRVLDLKKTPSLLITHDPQDVEQLAQSAFQIKDGMILTGS